VEPQIRALLTEHPDMLSSVIAAAASGTVAAAAHRPGPAERRLRPAQLVRAGKGLTMVSADLTETAPGVQPKGGSDLPLASAGLLIGTA
jgi:hypothetical protein